MPTPIDVWQPIAASRDTLWEACSTPAGLSLWQADQVEGSVEVGGTLTLSWPALGASVLLEVVDLIPSERVVLKNGDNRVELTVSTDGVRLRHTGLDDEDDHAGFASSWRLALALLRFALEKHAGRPRRVSWFVHPAHVTAEAAYVMFTHGAALATWLTASGDVPETGTRYAFDLANSERMSGEVLLREPGRDVALEWREQNAAVIMRTMPSPLSEDERLVALAVSRFGEATEVDEAFWENALLRLTRVLAQGGSA